MVERPEPPKPIPLWFGLYLTIITTVLFVGVYANAGETTTRGWLATFAVAFELTGVLLVASPELRPIIERLWAKLRTWPPRFLLRIRRLFGDRTQRISTGGAVSSEAALALEVQRGFEDPPPPEASVEAKVDYLLRLAERFKDLFSLLENQARRQAEDVRAELQRTASELTTQTTEAMRQVAESELRMRLLGVVCIIAGLVFAYGANIG